MSVRPRQIVLPCVLAGGFALLGASVHGLAGLDDRLAAAAHPVQIERSVHVVERDCPLREREQRSTSGRAEI